MRERAADALRATSDVVPDFAEAAALPEILPAAGPPMFDPWPDTSVHVEWGRTGAALAAARGDVVVVVDVLSFSTTLSIAASRDFTCLVYSGAEIESLGGPAMAAIRLGARPLSRRRRVEPGQVSLSPASLLEADPGQRVIFTSLNGASVVSAAAKAPALLIGSPRNATACAAVAAELMTGVRAGRITVVPCGEHWSSTDPATEGTRPAAEDWLGAGAVCEGLAARGYSLSAEARLAAASWSQPTALADVAECISARELRAAGFATDVTLALEVDADRKVPVRISGEQTGRVFRGMAARTGDGDGGTRAAA
ncbi:MAG TPA: 2-phosphosulfolactate phosphatase [Actinospica sp.]|nr:2-phosphosulfolactate phosphatase [Actinospica sp.]